MASTTVKLQNGDKLETDDDPQALADRFDSARRDGALLKVDTERGPVWINPHVLLTIVPGREYRAASS